MEKPPPFRGPPLTDTAAWTRMLAAARGADMIQTEGAQEANADPLTQLRMDTLLPVARHLYDQVVWPTAQNESVRVANVISHCQEYLFAREARHNDLGWQYGVRLAERWNKEMCEQEMDRLFVPCNPSTLRPASPAVIGALLVPQLSAWRLLRKEKLQDIPPKYTRIRVLYQARLQLSFRLGLRKKNETQSLRNARFVDNVLARAPPLVCALPARWTAADTTDILHEALQALLPVPGPRRLVDLVDFLSDSEYGILVEEHACLSQVLDMAPWSPNCANGCTLDEHVALARFLHNELGFKGPLAPVPHKQHAAQQSQTHSDASAWSNWLGMSGTDHAAKPKGPRLKRKIDQWLKLNVEPGPVGRVLQGGPTRPALWVRMLAAARGADQIQTKGEDALGADPLTRARLHMLLPIARRLYDEIVVPIAQDESQRMKILVAHCETFLIEKNWHEGTQLQDAEPWDMEQCRRAAGSLLVPHSLETLQPTPAEVIGFFLVPQISAWRLLVEQLERMLVQYTRERTMYNFQLLLGIRDGVVDSDALQPLRDVRFVDAVLEFAPPLVLVLPPLWTTADKTDNLHSLLLSLLQQRVARSFIQRVQNLSNAEYEFLAKEHWCLSQVLVRGTWMSECDDGRSLDDYLVLAGFLQHDDKFKGSLTRLPDRKQVPYGVSAKRLKLDPVTFPSRSNEPTRRSQRMTGKLPAKVGQTAGEGSLAPEDREDSDELIDLSLHGHDEVLEHLYQPGPMHAATQCSQRPCLPLPCEHDRNPVRRNAVQLPGSAVDLISATGVILGIVILVLAMVFRLRTRRLQP